MFLLDILINKKSLALNIGQKIMQMSENHAGGLRLILNIRGGERAIDISTEFYLKIQKLLVDIK